MAEVKRFHWVHWRRLSQAFFLLAFLALFFHTDFGLPTAPATHFSSTDATTLFFRADPLLASSVLLAERVIPALWWLALAVVLSAAFFNRAFCGWVCPFGTLHHLCSLGRQAGVREYRSERWKWRPSRNVKYVILFIVLGAALLGFNLAGWLDPLSFFNRSLAVGVHPVLGQGADAVISLLDRVGLSGLGDWLGALLRGRIIPFEPRVFLQAFTLGGLLAAALALNRRETRFWCRNLCPLGAFLGLFAGKSPLTLRKDTERCTKCLKCIKHCQGGDQPLPGAPWIPSECHFCGNCTHLCPEDALAFQYTWRSAERSGRRSLPDLNRRIVLGGLAGGFVLAPLNAAGANLLENQNRSFKLCDRLIRPPGAVAEKDFQSLCIKCGACLKVCPTNALQPASWQAGVGGVWTPVLVPKIGYCDDRCTLCGQVCPTGAIRRVSVEERLGGPGREPIRLGLAHVDRDRCLPWSLGRPCLVCEEVCPTAAGRKAVKAVEGDVVTPDGAHVRVFRPVVDPRYCIGCGLCEHKCPVADSAAIVVTSVGESRSPYNQITPGR